MLNSHRHLQRGLSLVELMVGITIGMIIAAGAAMVAVNQIGEHRRLMAETQLQQDLRTAADLIQQDLRRAGFRGAAQLGAWAPATSSGSPEMPAEPNGYTTVTVTNGTTDVLMEYSYARSTASGYQGLAAPADKEQFGVRWNRGSQTLYLKLGLNADGTPNWQPITDPEATPIVAFTVQPSTQSMSLEAFCDRTCPTGATCTPPQLALRQFDISIRAQSHLDPRVLRTVTIKERVRADDQTGACP